MSSGTNGLGGPPKSQHKLGHIKRALERAESGIKFVLVLLATVVVILVEVPWLQPLIKKYGLEDTNGLGAAIIAFILGMIFWEIRDLSPKEAPVFEKYFPTQQSIYPLLIEKAQTFRKKRERTLDVLGSTLDTAWPLLKIWLSDAQNNNWTIRLCALVDNRGFFPEAVKVGDLQVARASLDDVVRQNEVFGASNRGVVVEAYGYDFLPGVHGCRLGNGDLFFSVATWSPEGLIDLVAHGYHFVSCDDKSDSAAAMREAFDSWFTRASAIPWVQVLKIYDVNE